MVRFNGASHGCPGPRRCSHGLEYGRSRRDPRRQRAATDRHSQSCHSSRLNLRRGQRHCRTHEPYLVQSALRASASLEAAANSAAHEVLVNLFPAAASSLDALDAAILAGIPDGPQKTAGIVWGEFVANQILAARASDGFDAMVPATWRQRSWCLGADSPGISSIFASAMGIRGAVCNK
jgi:hypothetical protein